LESQLYILPHGTLANGTTNQGTLPLGKGNLKPKVGLILNLKLGTSNLNGNSKNPAQDS